MTLKGLASLVGALSIGIAAYADAFHETGSLPREYKPMKHAGSSHTVLFNAIANTNDDRFGDAFVGSYKESTYNNPSHTMTVFIPPFKDNGKYVCSWLEVHVAHGRVPGKSFKIYEIDSSTKQRVRSIPFAEDIFQDDYCQTTQYMDHENRIGDVLVIPLGEKGLRGASSVEVEVKNGNDTYSGFLKLVWQKF